MLESKSTKRQRELRLEIIEKLGGRCENPGCRWRNDDGTTGCTDVRALQIDHKRGGGSTERQTPHGGGLAYYSYVLTDLKYAAMTGRKSPYYQLLCANCNWIKRSKDKEARGADQHKRPARLRPGLQVKGHPVRRVTKRRNTSNTGFPGRPMKITRDLLFRGSTIISEGKMTWQS